MKTFSFVVQDLRKKQEPAVDKLKQPILDEITGAIASRYKLSFTRQDTSSLWFLWFLCKQEASLLDITNQACALFNPHEIALLEWTDDLEVFILKGYGKALNYRMGVLLLKDVQSTEEAIQANEGDTDVSVLYCLTFLFHFTIEVC
ncbi:Thioredoxin domain-containing protein [Psidium guajava]|nr:Thioredoxin domain-containing protein [Psidium guajava]